MGRKDLSLAGHRNAGTRGLCSPSSPFLVLRETLGGCAGTVQLAGAITGVEVKVLIQLSTRLERVIVWPSSGLAVARGAGFQSLLPFHPPCGIFPGDADGAGKYICSCTLGA